MVIEGLVTKDDAAKTANDVLACSGLIRFGLAALVVAVILDVVVAWALMTFFEPVDKDLSRLAAWFFGLLVRLGHKTIDGTADSFRLLNEALKKQVESEQAKRG